MYRLFVAISLPDRIIDELMSISFGVAGARWLEPDQIHLTLRFIGEVDGGQFRDVGEVRKGEIVPAPINVNINVEKE